MKFKTRSSIRRHPKPPVPPLCPIHLAQGSPSLEHQGPIDFPPKVRKRCEAALKESKDVGAKTLANHLAGGAANGINVFFNMAILMPKLLLEAIDEPENPVRRRFEHEMDAALKDLWMEEGFSFVQCEPIGRRRRRSDRSSTRGDAGPVICGNRTGP